MPALRGVSGREGRHVLGRWLWVGDRLRPCRGWRDQGLCPRTGLVTSQRHGTSSRALSQLPPSLAVHRARRTVRRERQRQPGRPAGLWRGSGRLETCQRRAPSAARRGECRAEASSTLIARPVISFYVILKTCLRRCREGVGIGNLVVSGRR